MYNRLPCPVSFLSVKSRPNGLQAREEMDVVVSKLRQCEFLLDLSSCSFSLFLIAIASNLLAMASNLLAMASTGIPFLRDDRSFCN